MVHELGVWNTAGGDQLPAEAMWMVGSPAFTPPTNPGVKVIVQDYYLMRPDGVRRQFDTVEYLTYIEDKLKAMDLTGVWGLLMIGEEVYRSDVRFVDDMDMLWFGERLVGQPIYIAENPGADRESWKDEMFLRMYRGFHDYFSPTVKVGITFSLGLAIWYSYGLPAMEYMRDNFDFAILYAYSTNLEDFIFNTKPHFIDVDTYFSGPQMTRLWVLTRIWASNEVWESEAMALEMKNCFDRNIVVMCYYWNNPPFEVVWPLILRARELYNARAPYTESIVYDENLLLGYVGDTYGWVANPEHDEGLYPSGILSFGKIALIAGAYYLLKGR